MSKAYVCRMPTGRASVTENTGQRWRWRHAQETHDSKVAYKAGEGDRLSSLGLGLPLLVLVLVVDEDQVLVGVLMWAVDDGENLGHCVVVVVVVGVGVWV